MVATSRDQSYENPERLQLAAIRVDGGAGGGGRVHTGLDGVLLWPEAKGIPPHGCNTASPFIRRNRQMMSVPM